MQSIFIVIYYSNENERKNDINILCDSFVQFNTQQSKVIYNKKI